MVTTDRANKAIEGMWHEPRLDKTHPNIGYVEISTAENEFCGNCRYWLYGREEPLGDCSIVAGSIKQPGYCEVWEGVRPVVVEGKESLSVVASISLEAKLAEKTGTEWDVLIIEAGKSLNGRVYPLEVLHRDKDVF